MRGRKRQPNRKSLGGVVELPIHGNHRKCQSLRFPDRGPNTMKVASRQFGESDPLETLNHCIKLNQVNNLTECAIALSDLKFKGLSFFIDQPFVRADWHLGSRSLCVDTPKGYRHIETKSHCDEYEDKLGSYKKRKQNQVSVSDESKKFKFLAPSGVYVDVATAPRSRPDLRHGIASMKETKSSDLLSSASSDVFSTGRNPHSVNTKNKFDCNKTGPGVEEDSAAVDMGSLYVEGRKSMSPAPNESKSTTMDLDATAGNQNAFDLHRRPQEPDLDDDILDDYAIARILSERFGSEKRYPEKITGVSATVMEDLQLGRNSLEKSSEEQGSLAGRTIDLDLNSPMPIKNAPVFSSPESNLSQMTRLPSPIPYQSCSTPDSVSGPTDSFKLEKSNEMTFNLSDERDEVSEAEFPNPGETITVMGVTTDSIPNSFNPGYIRSSDQCIESSTSNLSPSIEDEQPEPLNIVDPFPLTQNETVPTPSFTTVGHESNNLESRAVELKSGGTLKAMVVDLNKEDLNDFCSRSSFVFIRQNRPKFDPKTFQSLSTVKSTSGVYVYKRNKCNEDNVKSILLSENDTSVNSVPC